MTPDEQKRRNYLIVGMVGGFILPLAGMFGAVIFWSQGDRPAATQVAAASTLGLVAYLVAIGVL
jgi:zinc transporter ZupT